MIARIDKLLLAVVRLLLAQAIRFPEAAERLKMLYVRAATSGAGKTTDSEVSVVTGLQRRDVARLRKMRSVPNPPPNPLSRIVAVWQTNSQFSGANGADPLPRSGSGASFETLARFVGKDVHPRTMLDALVQAGTVKVDGDNVYLMQAAYQPGAGTVEQIDYLAANVGDHLNAAVSNTLGAKHFERAVHYNGLTQDDVEQLRAEYEVAQMEVLRQLNSRAAALQAEAPEGANHRFRCGGYFWSETTDKKGN